MNKRQKKKQEKKKITVDKLVKIMHKMSRNFTHIAIDDPLPLFKDFKFQNTTEWKIKEIK